jgi:hypothetical protein
MTATAYSMEGAATDTRLSAAVCFGCRQPFEPHGAGMWFCEPCQAQVDEMPPRRGAGFLTGEPFDDPQLSERRKTSLLLGQLAQRFDSQDSTGAIAALLRRAARQLIEVEDWEADRRTLRRKR